MMNAYPGRTQRRTGRHAAPPPTTLQTTPSVLSQPHRTGRVQAYQRPPCPSPLAPKPPAVSVALAAKWARPSARRARQWNGCIHEKFASTYTSASGQPKPASSFQAAASPYVGCSEPCPNLRRGGEPNLERRIRPFLGNLCPQEWVSLAARLPSPAARSSCNKNSSSKPALLALLLGLAIRSSLAVAQRLDRLPPPAEPRRQVRLPLRLLALFPQPLLAIFSSSRASRASRNPGKLQVRPGQ